MKSLESRGATELISMVQEAYSRGIDDYHMVPLRPAASDSSRSVMDGDSVVFCCRRGEREIELTEMFTDPDFCRVPVKHLKDLRFVLMTQYHEKFSRLPIAFPPLHVTEPLAEVLSKAGKTQLHAAESEKFAHVTFFFNGGVNEAFEGEDDICIPSPKGIPFEQKPELSVEAVADSVIERIGSYDFIVVNFANGDVIGHTSDSSAKLEACSHVSRNLERVVRRAAEEGYAIAVTADHGNIETLRTSEGNPHVAHTSNKVAFILIDGKNSDYVLHDGSLSDVAPTVLDLMGVSVPDNMTGKSLIESRSADSPRRVLLLILDGWGIGSHNDNDAIYLSETPYWDSIAAKYPICFLDASGRHVGLADGKPGNSEAGHMNLGAGRCVYQDDVRIDASISDGSFDVNPVILEAIDRSIGRKRPLHLIAYLTYKSSHGSIEHAVEICRMAKNRGLDDVCLHIIFDGRSTEPGSAPAMLLELERKLNDIGAGYIVDGIGRGLALDRDGNYQNVKHAYDMMTE